MEYDDDEILIYNEDEIIEHRRLWHVNLAILLRPSNGTFDVVKSRWGKCFSSIPLNYLDDFLEDPLFNWETYFKLYEPGVVKT